MRAAVVLLALAIAGGAQASELARQARFSALFDGAETISIARETRPGGLTITGEKIQLESGNFTAANAPRTGSMIGVSAIPGQSACTLIGASCGATARTKPTTACLVIE